MDNNQSYNLCNLLSPGKKYTQLSNLTWTFQHLKDHLVQQKVDTDGLFESINEAIVRTLLSAEYRLLRDSYVRT